MADTERVPTVAEFALLSAARSGRLKRFYYIREHTDAVVGAGMGGGGGKVPSERLLPLLAAGWVIEPPDASVGFDAAWKLTDAGSDARQRWLSQPKGRKKK